MKYVEQLGILFAVCFVGYILSRLSPLPIPASICSMLILFVLLLCGAIKVEAVADTADFLLSIMAVFFIPSGVAIMEHLEFLKGRLFLVCVISAIAMIATFFAAALSGWAVKRLTQRRRESQ